MPVVKEIVADLLTPVSAFLKIAEHADYAFLLESVEGGEHVARYSFLGKDPFLILRARDGSTTIDRGGHTSASDTPFVETLRRLMADFRSPFVPDLPRLRRSSTPDRALRARARQPGHRGRRRLARGLLRRSGRGARYRRNRDRPEG